MHLRTFNLVPDGSPIFQSCEDGNLAQVQWLIENGEASLLDVVCDVYLAYDGKITLIGVSSR